jgi:hypothetical protein
LKSAQNGKEAKLLLTQYSIEHLLFIKKEKKIRALAGWLGDCIAS